MLQRLKLVTIESGAQQRVVGIWKRHVEENPVSGQGKTSDKEDGVHCSHFVREELEAALRVTTVELAKRLRRADVARSADAEMDEDT